ncbi:DNA-binding protein HU 1 [Alphaproteobacteria bacterium]
MNKTEFVAAYAKKASSTKTEATRLVDIFLQLVVEALSNGEEIVRFVGFGTFKVVNVKEKTVRNPQNGQEMKVPASRRPKFVPGKDFKEIVNKKSK